MEKINFCASKNYCSIACCLVLAVLILSPGKLYAAACFGPFVDNDHARAACNSQLAPNPDADCMNEQPQNTCGGYYHAVKLYRDCLGGSGSGCSFPYYPGSCPAGEWSDPETGICKPLEDNPAPARNLGSCKHAPSDFVGNPVRVSTGNNYLRETDHDGFGRGVLKFERVYNSGLALLDPPQPVWRHSYERRIRNTQTPSGRFRVADRPDGSSIYFRRNSTQSSEWFSENDVHEVLAHTSQNGVIVEYRLTLTDGSVERYDGNGVLQSITDLAGRTRSLVYNTAGLLERIESNTGEYFMLGYDDLGRYTTLSDHTGRVWVYEYNPDGNLQYVYYPDGSQDTRLNNPYRKYHYGDDRFRSALTGVSDRVLGQEERYASWEYDALGRATASYHGPVSGVPQDRIDGVTISYDAPFIRTVTDSRGDVRTYTIANLLGRYRLGGVSRTGCADCSDGERKYVYDPDTNHLLSSTENGVVTEYGNYTGRGEPRFRIEAKGTSGERRIDYTYDPRFHGKVATLTEPSVNPAGRRITRSIHDDYGNRLEETVAGYSPDGQGGWLDVSRTTRYRYDGPLHQLSEIDGYRIDVNDITTFRYYEDDPAEGDNRARLREIEDASGVLLRSNINYTPTGKIASEDRPNGLSLVYSYYPGNDRLESLTRSNDSSSNTTRWTYLETGEIRSITTAHGTVDATRITLEYDAARRLVRILDGNGNSVEYTLDTQGNPVEETVRDSDGILGRIVSRTFTIYNQLDMTTRENETVQYDISPDGKVIQQADGNGYVTQFDYDSLNRLVGVSQDPGGLNAITRYDYDASSRPARVIDPENGVTSYEYDDFGNLVRLTSPDTGLTGYAYDQAGNRISRIDSKGQRFTYVYDSLNRMVSLDAPGTVDDISYEYDSCINGAGRLCRVIMGESVVSYQYDVFGNISAHQQLGYTYDPAGRLESIAYPSGATVTYHHDATGQINKVDLHADGETRTLASAIVRVPFGGITALVYGNGKILSQGFDRAYRLIDQHVPAVLELDYREYDANGNLVQKQDAVAQTSSHYSYDPLNRLDTVGGDSTGYDFDHDLNGNRVHLGRGSTDTSYSYMPGSNRILSETGWRYTLDDNGNITGRIKADGSGEGRSYGYTAHNRLASVVEHVTAASGSGQTTGLQSMPVSTYVYNGLGQRITKQVTDTPAVRFLYGTDGLLMTELDEAGDIIREYVYLDGQLLAVLVQETIDADQEIREIVMDDGDPGTIATGDWRVKKVNKAYEKDVHVSRSAGNTYRWTPDLEAGTYDAYAWYVRRRSHGEMNFRISHAGKVSTATLDQSHGEGGWYRLGSGIQFDGSGGEYIEASSTDGLTTADALRFVKTGAGAKTDTLTGIYYVHNDHLGAPQVMTDESATVVWRAEYDPFGKSQVSLDTVGLNIRFPGQYYDQETGLHYNYFRYYDPLAGRYITSDPVGLNGGLNTFAYAMGNPLLFIDPLGLAIEGRWVQKPTPFVSDARVEFGRGNARRPDDWWKIWENIGTYKAMEHRVSVDAGYDWKVKCTDTDECTEESWDLDGGWDNWIDIWVPVSTPAIPHPGGYYSFLARNTYSLLIRPAMSHAMEQVTQAANLFGTLGATWICMNYPRTEN